MSNDLSIQIGDAKFKALLSEAILASLTAESRDKLIGEALQTLIAPQVTGSGYQKTESPSIVQREFGRVVAEIGREVIAELVKSDPVIRVKVEALVRDTLLALMEKPDAADLIASAMWGGIEKARY
jgi:hypothetical protein